MRLDGVRGRVLVACARTLLGTLERGHFAVRSWLVVHDLVLHRRHRLALILNGGVPWSAGGSVASEKRCYGKHCTLIVYR